MSFVHEPRTRTARKAHPCWWCGELIAAGGRYVIWTWADNGEIGEVRVHPECKTAWDTLDRDDAECVGFSDFSRGCICEHGDCHCERAEAKGGAK